MVRRCENWVSIGPDQYRLKIQYCHLFVDRGPVIQWHFQKKSFNYPILRTKHSSIWAWSSRKAHISGAIGTCSKCSPLSFLFSKFVHFRKTLRVDYRSSVFWSSSRLPYGKPKPTNPLIPFFTKKNKKQKGYTNDQSTHFSRTHLRPKFSIF